MKAFNIETVARELGHCCAASFLKMEEVKAHAKGWPAISPAHLSLKTGLSYSTTKRIKSRWQAGDIKCKGEANCLRDKLNQKDPESDIPVTTKAFYALRGQKITLFRAAIGNHEMVREEPSSPGIIVDISRVPWLWIKVTMETDREVLLGEQLWLENIAYGTIFDIDLRNIYVLLPGHRHGSKRKG